MTYISYAQNYEDIMLMRALNHIENGFYIDVGANDPEVHSVTKNFYDLGWRGVNVEPLSKNHKRFLEKRPEDININNAISDENNILKIWESEDELGGLATLDEKIALRHEKNGYKGSWSNVKVITLKQLFEELGEVEVHFLKIDVEGFEKKVVEGGDWAAYRPWIVVLESTQPLSQEETHMEWEHYLIDNNYHLTYADGLNRFYIANEHSDLDLAFRYPPNVFDCFVKDEPFYKNRISRLENELDLLNNEIKNKDKLINDVFSSLSWKVTEPLRLIRKIFKKSSK